MCDLGCDDATVRAFVELLLQIAGEQYRLYRQSPSVENDANLERVKLFISMFSPVPGDEVFRALDKQCGYEEPQQSSLPRDVARQIVLLKKQGIGTHKIAQRLGLDPADVFREIQRYNAATKKPRRTFSEEESRKMIDLYLSGKSINAIAGEMACSTDSVERRVRKFCAANKINRRQHYISDAQISRIRELNAEGLTQVEIAARCDVSPSTVFRYIH